MNSYAPYGDLISSEGSFDTPYGYTGELTDSSGLINLRARWYDTSTGRFTSKDTWAGDYQNPITLGKWLYANANLVMYTDPSGNYAQAILAAIMPSIIGLGAGIAAGVIAGAIYGICTYATALANKCGCDVQSQALSMTESEWIKMNAISAGLMGGFTTALLAAEPVGPVILGIGTIYISAKDLIPAMREVKKVGLTTCMLTRIFLDVAGIVFGTSSIVKGVRAWRASGTPSEWVIPETQLKGRAALLNLVERAKQKQWDVMEFRGGNAEDFFWRIVDDDSVKPFPEPISASQGGLIGNVPGGGTITYRPITKSGSPTIQLNGVPGYNINWKIHFLNK